VGGSIAERRIKCPASFAEQLKAPPGGTSVYAEHGTAMHEAIGHWQKDPDADLEGMTFNEHRITGEDIDELLTPAWDALVELQETYGGGFRLTHSEKRVQFPGIAGAYGTVDTVLESATHFIIVDYKFGRGVQVLAHEDGELNAQLLFYLSGAVAKNDKRKLVVAIVQPAFSPALTHAPVSREQLDEFEATLHHAVALATSANPPRQRGEWCRFAPCKVTCRAWSGPLLDLTALGVPSPQKKRDDMQWGELLAAAKRLVDSAVLYQKEIDKALMEHLQNGGSAPGFALKQQVKNRAWLEDTKLVAKELAKLGLSDAEIWQHKLQTFKVTDAAAKKRGTAIPDALRPRPHSNDLVLTYEGDPSAVSPGRLSAEFSAALKRLDAQA
jgi:hypothetical protein